MPPGGREATLSGVIPALLVRRLDTFLREQLEQGAGSHSVDFTRPAGEAALAGPDSVSWRIFRNPLALFIGGITAVLMELAEPRVRSGVWEHTSFRTDPLTRMRRTGYAAMVTVYAARSVAEGMIAGVNRMHARIEGVTPDGVRYRADDPELLRWVHATALFGFMEAYARFVRPLTPEERDRFVAEGVPAARLYGAHDAPDSAARLERLVAATLPQLEPSGIVDEFLGIMRTLPLLPRPLRGVNGMLVDAAIGLLPHEVRAILGLPSSEPSATTELLGSVGRRIDGLSMASSPAAQACVRLGLPADHLGR